MIKHRGLLIDFSINVVITLVDLLTNTASHNRRCSITLFQTTRSLRMRVTQTLCQLATEANMALIKRIASLLLFL